MIGSQKKWKYLSIGLLAILAVGFSVPQAFAHVTNSLAHNVGHIIDALTDLQSDVTDIMAKTDNLPSDPASESAVGTEHTVVIEERHIDPADLTIETISVLPLESGKSYRGHLALTVFGLGATDTTNSMAINCQTSGTTFSEYGYNSGLQIDQDFSCLSVDIDVLDNLGGTDAPALEINGVIQYVESSDITVITDPA
ncbi:MAG: hypothetical protein ACREBU_04815 [Nitrososphaera sp.]